MIAKTHANTLLVLSVICLTQVYCGRAAQPSKPISKSQALRDVKDATVSGWKESVSEDGRFRILFPELPEATNHEPGALQGFKLVNGQRNMFALYRDGNDSVVDDSELRDRFHQSIKALTKRGATLASQKDIRLNGKLGVEFILEGQNTKSYMRTFQINKRIYTIAVDFMSGIPKGNEIPDEVRHFFDSFTFWE